MAGLQVVELPSDSRGNVDLEALKANLDDTVAGLMLTNPNTLGLFEEHVLEVTQLVHEAGGLVYGDGANLNAIVGVAKPGQLGIDVMHFNLHKTFSTPHGGGGPGAGPVAVVEKLAPFLPGPLVAVEKVESDEPHFHDDEDDDHDHDGYRLVWHTPSKSIGRVRSYWGSFGVLVRAYTYIRMHGAEGLRRIAENAVLNANYMKARLQAEGSYPVAYGERTCMHEFVAQGILEGAPDVHTMDIAKRLMDYNFHPPTVYFPLIVKEALMIEPTETESKAPLDAFADALIQIAQEAREQPELLKEAPHRASMRRLDEVRAARELILCRC
jgi:glycine dehydrogenase subunit 2